jgi:uncharacterized protein YegL
MSTTEILFIADESGSMASCWDASISSFNEYLDDVRNGLEGEARMTFVKFNTSVSQVYANKVLDKVPHLNRETYMPNGMTALYDAVGKSVTKLSKKLKKDDRALVIIMTDGAENSSREYTQRGVASLIQALEGKGNWTFVFLGANQDSWVAGGNLGISRGNISNYAQTYDGLHTASKGLASATVARHRSAMGTTASYFADAGLAHKADGTLDESTVAAAENTILKDKLWTPESKSEDIDSE